MQNCAYAFVLHELRASRIAFVTIHFSLIKKAPVVSRDRCLTICHTSQFFLLQASFLIEIGAYDLTSETTKMEKQSQAQRREFIEEAPVFFWHSIHALMHPSRVGRHLLPDPERLGHSVGPEAPTYAQARGATQRLEHSGPRGDAAGGIARQPLLPALRGTIAYPARMAAPRGVYECIVRMNGTVQVLPLVVQ